MMSKFVIYESKVMKKKLRKSSSSVHRDCEISNNGSFDEPKIIKKPE